MSTIFCCLIVRDCLTPSVKPAGLSVFFFFNDTAPTEFYTFPLHDAFPIFLVSFKVLGGDLFFCPFPSPGAASVTAACALPHGLSRQRSEIVPTKGLVPEPHALPKLGTSIQP